MFLSKTLESKSIPTPKLILKDHKKADKDGYYSSRLIVPANNFTSGFPRLRNLGIRRILDSSEVNYKDRTITQALKLEEDI